MRAELNSKASGDADATYEAEKQRAGEEKRAQLAAAQAAYETAAAEAQVGGWAEKQSARVPLIVSTTCSPTSSHQRCILLCRGLTHSVGESLMQCSC